MERAKISPDYLKTNELTIEIAVWSADPGTLKVPKLQKLLRDMINMPIKHELLDNLYTVEGGRTLLLQTINEIVIVVIVF